MQDKRPSKRERKRRERDGERGGGERKYAMNKARLQARNTATVVQRLTFQTFTKTHQLIGTTIPKPTCGAVNKSRQKPAISMQGEKDVHVHVRVRLGASSGACASSSWVLQGTCVC